MSVLLDPERKMYKDITDFEELPQGWGRLYVGSLPMDTGPIRVGDTVTVKIAADIELYIQVESIEHQTLGGVLVAIGPRPRIKFGDWKVEDRVIVAEQAVRTVIRTG
jgi:hypothetical protein